MDTMDQIFERLGRIESLLWRLSMAPEPGERKRSLADMTPEERRAHSKQLRAENAANIKAFNNRQRRAA
jgi:hypothetical protein